MALLDDSANMPMEVLIQHTATVDLLAGFVIRRSSFLDLPAGFESQVTDDLFATFVVRHSTTLNLPAGFLVKQWMESLPARFRTMKVYDLRGTAGIAFYWQGADNPPESIVDFIVESATGFWVAEFYDGPASLRYVFIPWTQFRETGIDGTRPDLAQVDGFIWIVHTAGLRRIDYIHSPLFGNLLAGFFVINAGTSDLNAGFNTQHLAVPRDLKASFDAQASLNLPASLTVNNPWLLMPHAMTTASGDFIIAHAALKREPADEITLAHANDIPP